MGRLPATYGGKTIRLRTPYTMPGELITAVNTQGNSFPDSTFFNTVNRPFECHRVVVSLQPYDNTATPVIVQPPWVGAIGAGSLENILRQYIRLRILNTTLSENMNKSAQLVASLVRENTNAWEWEEPFTIPNGDGFSVAVDNILPAGGFTITVGATTVTVTNVRVAIAFEGFLLQTELPTENR